MYWRRRLVAIALALLLALLAFWAVNSGGNGGDGKSSNGKGPVSSITPGPSSSGPAISERPGGRDDTGGTDTGGSEDGGTGESEGEGGEDSSGGSGTGGSGTAGGNVGFDVGEDGVPAGSSLPDCRSSSVQLQLRADKKTYEKGEQPKFELIAVNSAGSACKLDFAPTAAVLTIKDGDDRVWSSKDCPWTDDPILLRVPADGEMSRSITWDRKPSEPECAKPEKSGVGSGTFEAVVSADGLPSDSAEFKLES